MCDVLWKKLQFMSNRKGLSSEGNVSLPTDGILQFNPNII